MFAISILDFLDKKDIKLVIENKRWSRITTKKFVYKNRKYSICMKNIRFAYRTNSDEFRIQVGENLRNILKDDHQNGYWALIIGYHKKSNTYVSWDNKLLFNSKAKNRSLYTRDSICNRTAETGFEHYRYRDNSLKEDTVSINFKGKYFKLYLNQIKNLNIHQYENFINFYRNLDIRN